MPLKCKVRSFLFVVYWSSNLVEFQKMLRPYVLRRMKLDVEKLPPKVDTLVEVEMTTLQKRFYRAIYEKNRKYLNSLSRKAFLNDHLRIRNGVSLSNIGIQLRKCCNHPFLLKGVEQIVSKEIEEKQKKLRKRLDNEEVLRTQYEEYKQQAQDDDGIILQTGFSF